MTFEDIMNYSPGNREVFKEIVENENLVPFVGAGLSAFAYPIWKDFLKSSYEKLKDDKKTPENKDLFKSYLSKYEYEKAASFLKEQLGEAEFYTVIREQFSPTGIFMNDLSKQAVYLLPILFEGMVLTTNFDKVLDQIYNEPIIILPGYDIPLTNNKPILYKFHGDICYADTIVLTSEDYAMHYNKESKFRKNLEDYFEQKSFLFLGCSLSQDRTMEILNNIVWKIPGAVNYAVINCKKENIRERADNLFGIGCIKAIYYEDDHHEAVRIILEKLLEERNPKSFYKLKYHESFPRLRHGMISTVKFSNSREIIAAGDNNGYINIFNNGEYGFCIKYPPQNLNRNDKIWSVAFDKSDKKLALAGVGGRITLLDISDLADIREIHTRLNNNSNADITSIAFDPFNENRLAFGCSDGKIKIADIFDSNKDIVIFNHRENEMKRIHNIMVHTISFHPNKKDILASGGSDGNVIIWDLSSSNNGSGKKRNVLSGGNSSIYSISFNQRGDMIACGNSSGSMTAWKLAEDISKTEKTFSMQNNNVHRSAVAAVAFYSNDEIVSASHDRSIKLWEINDQTNTLDFSRLIGNHNDDINAISCKDDYLVSGGNDTCISIRKISSGDVIKEFTGLNDSISSISFSSNGNYIACGSSNNSMVIWRRRINMAPKLLNHPYRNRNKITSTVFFNHGKFEYIACGDDHGTIEYYKVNGNNIEKVNIVNYTGGKVRALAVCELSNYGKVLAIGANNSRIQFCHIDMINNGVAGSCEPEDYFTENWLGSLAFSCDGKYFAYSNIKNEIVVLKWDSSTRNYNKVYLIEKRKDLEAIVFSPDPQNYGLMAYACKIDNRSCIVLVDLNNKNETIPPISSKANGVITSLAFSKNGKFLVAGHACNPGESTADIFLYDIENKKWTDFSKHKDSDVYSVSFIPESDDTIICCGKDPDISRFSINEDMEGSENRTWLSVNPSKKYK